MLPDRVSNPGPLTYESGALPIALRGPAASSKAIWKRNTVSAADATHQLVVVVVLLFYVHSKHLRSCWDGQST